MSSPSCIICYDDLDGSEDISALHCGHVFHYRCIKDWGKSCGSRRSAYCPTCKRKIEWLAPRGTVFKLYLEFDVGMTKSKRVEELEAKLAREQERAEELEAELARERLRILEGNNRLT